MDNNFYVDLLEKTREYLKDQIPPDLPFDSPRLKDAFLIITVSQAINRWSIRDRFYFWLYRRAYRKIHRENLTPVWKGNGVADMKREIL